MWPPTIKDMLAIAAEPKYLIFIVGWVAEWFKAAVLKTAESERAP